MSKAAVGDSPSPPRDHLSQETSLIVTGTARADKRAPSGYEIDVSQLEVVGESHDYPITPKEHGVDYLLDRRHLWIRSERQQAILRVRHEVIDAVRDFFNYRGFILTDAPDSHARCLRGHDDAVSRSKYLDDQKAYLTQSGQLYSSRPPWHSGGSIASVRRFAPRSRRPGGTSRSSGWSNPRWLMRDLDDVMDAAKVWSSRSWRECSRNGGGAHDHRARYHETRVGAGAISAHQLRRGGANAPGAGPADRVGRRFRRT